MRSILALVAALAVLPAPAANPLETIDVLCGGTSPDERAHLAAEVRAATIELEFYRGTKGEYVSDVDVLFTPVNAPAGAFGIVTNGPVCLLELPPGEYRVNTWHNGNARSTRATIGKQAAGARVRISLGFPQEEGRDAFLVPVAEERKP